MFYDTSGNSAFNKLSISTILPPRLLIFLVFTHFDRQINRKKNQKMSWLIFYVIMLHDKSGNDTYNAHFYLWDKRPHSRAQDSVVKISEPRILSSPSCSATSNYWKSILIMQIINHGMKNPNI